MGHTGHSLGPLQWPCYFLRPCLRVQPEGAWMPPHLMSAVASTPCRTFNSSHSLTSGHASSRASEEVHEVPSREWLPLQSPPLLAAWGWGQG